MVVKLLVFEFVIVLKIKAVGELGRAWGHTKPGKQGTSHNDAHKRNSHRARGGKKGASSREMSSDCFFFLSLLDLREAEELYDGWMPGIPELVSQFERKIKERRRHNLWS